MPWVNNVHLILSSPSQVPLWLNVGCDKLEVHFHKEFIPINLLPTFNSNCIEMYLHRIRTLADNYVLFNDDQFVLNSLTEDFFMSDDKYVYQLEENALRFNLDSSVFRTTLDNNLMFEINYCADHKLPIKKFRHNHLPEIHSKKNEEEIFKGKEQFFLMSFIESRFRNKKNLTNWMFSDIIKLKNNCINKKIYSNSKYIKLNDDFEQLRGCDLVCINDDSSCSFEERVMKLREFLESMYGKKSIYEK